ncbi:MAG: hypothetical protein Kow002_13500 [Anaerolineales bacterium]
MLKRYRLLSLGFVISILILAALACAQSGKILTAAEATASAAPTTVPTAETVEGYSVGDQVYLIGKLYLVNLFDGPGSRKIIAGQERGAIVTITNSALVDGVIWYEIDAPTGQGWVPQTNLSTEAP